MKELLKELQEFDHERFNEHYRNLIDVAITLNREDEVLQALSFLDSCQTFIEKVKNTLENLPDETHCQHCAQKDKLLELADELKGLLKEELEKYKEKCIKLTDENIRLYKELETTKKQPESL
jgi:hypothetical protein